ncbi:9957_t:CDS:2, partial [Racocetra persica]
MDKFHQLYIDIETATSLTDLRSIDIEVYDQEQVPNLGKWDRMKVRKDNKELALFETAFEGAGAGPSAKDGVEERKVYDNGWTEPDEIDKPDGFFSIYPHVNYQIPSTETLKDIWIKAEVKKVKKEELDKVKKLLDDIRRENSASNLPANYADFQAGIIENLPDDHTLPEDYRKSKIIALYQDYHFKNVGGAADTFVGSNIFQPDVRKKVLAYRKQVPDIFGEREITGAEAGQIYNNGWDPAEIDIDFIEGITAIQKFKNGASLSLTDQQILEYLKLCPSSDSGLFLMFIPPQEAPTINTYSSYGQTDQDLDALTIDREELDKVNSIIKQINDAKSLSDLPAETDINIMKYEEKKVPATKNYAAIKNQIKDKKAQLDQDAADLTARHDAIQAVEKNRLISLINEAKIKPDITEIEAELNKKPVVSSSELKNSDYQTEMINLDDSQRATQKQEIIKEINQIRENKLEKVRQIITQAQNIFNKDAATKKELEQVINDLNTLANAPSDSAEKIIWTEKETENKKLLTDLEAKLNTNFPPEPEKEEPNEKPEIPAPLTPQEEAEKYGSDFANLKPTQQEGRKKI